LAIMRQFDSLLHTGRIKILLPPLSSTNFDIDPNDHPMTAVALERERSKRPLKTRLWKMTRADQHFCADLDTMIKSAARFNFDRIIRMRMSSPRPLHLCFRIRKSSGEDDLSSKVLTTRWQIIL